MSNLVMQSILPAPNEYAMMKDMAKMAINSGLLPSSVNSPEKAMIIILKGRELNIPPMLALSHISVINGKPCMSAELMLSKIYENCKGAVVDIISTTDTECVISAKRPGGSRTQISFTKADAEKAGLLNKGPWKTYPSAMYRARAISAMARAMFPDAINGVSYTPEELGAEVVIDDNGNESVEKEVKDTKPPEDVTTPIVPPQDPPKEPEGKGVIQKKMEALQNHVPKFDPTEGALADPGEYRFDFGQFKGRMMKDIDVKEIHKLYLHYMNAINRGQEPSQVYKIQIANIKKYLIMMAVEV